MEIQDALKRIEWGYGGVEEATVLRNALREIAAWGQAASMALLDHDLARIGLQLKRIRALADVGEKEP